MKTTMALTAAVLLLALVCCVPAAAKKKAPPPLDPDALEQISGVSTCSGDTLRVVAFNIHMGEHPDAVAAYLKSRLDLGGPVVFLLGEADRYHSRSGDRHNARDLAKKLGLNMLYGVEFVELNDTTPDTPGSSGNAILSNCALDNPRLLRHSIAYDWEKLGALADSPRRAQRMALFADARIGDRTVRVISAHLENRSDGPGRAKQMREILDAVAGDSTPTVIGGDLNEQSGPLFNDAATAGFVNAFSGDKAKTGGCIKSRSKPLCTLKLDWIFHRGLDSTAAVVDSPADSDDNLISDHAPVRAEYALK